MEKRDYAERLDLGRKKLKQKMSGYVWSEKKNGERRSKTLHCAVISMRANTKSSLKGIKCPTRGSWEVRKKSGVRLPTGPKGPEDARVA